MRSLFSATMTVTTTVVFFPLLFSQYNGWLLARKVVSFPFSYTFKRGHFSASQEHYQSDGKVYATHYTQRCCLLCVISTDLPTDWYEFEETPRNTQTFHMSSPSSVASQFSSGGISTYECSSFLCIVYTVSYLTHQSSSATIFDSFVLLGSQGRARCLRNWRPVRMLDVYFKYV